MGSCVMRWRSMIKGIVVSMCHNVARGRYEGIAQ